MRACTSLTAGRESLRLGPCQSLAQLRSQLLLPTRGRAQSTRQKRLLWTALPARPRPRECTTQICGYKHGRLLGRPKANTARAGCHPDRREFGGAARSISADSVPSSSMCRSARFRRTCPRSAAPRAHSPDTGASYAWLSCRTPEASRRGRDSPAFTAPCVPCVSSGGRRRAQGE